MFLPPLPREDPFGTVERKLAPPRDLDADGNLAHEPEAGGRPISTPPASPRPSMQVARCRYCFQVILWATKERGGRIPLEPQVRAQRWVWRFQPDGTVSQRGSGLGHPSHTCPAGGAA